MRIPRLPWDQFFMLHAHLTATRSTCDRGPTLLFHPGRRGVGAVLVRDHRVIAGGFNGSPPGQPHCNELRCDLCKETKQIVLEGVIPKSVKEITRSEALEMVGKEHGTTCIGRLSQSGVWRGDHLMIDGHCRRTIHSERNALLQCALDGVSPKGSSLYCTASPCYDCAKDIIRAGIVKVFYGEPYDSRYGLSDSVKELLEGANIEVSQLTVKL